MLQFLKRFDVRISVLYGVIATIWIVFSDAVAVLIFGNNHPLENVINLFKGLGFVVLTTLGLFFLLSAELRKRAHIEKELELERDISPTAILVFDAKGLISYINVQAEKILGLPRSEIIGTPYDALIWKVTDHEGKSIAGDYPNISKQLASRQTIFGIKQAIEVVEGKRVLLDINMAPMFDKTNTISGAVVTFTDVTASQTHEKQLRESEESFRLLFKNNPLPMVVFEPQTLAFLEINEAAIIHYGYSRDEFLAMRVIDILVQENIPALLDHIQQPRESLMRMGESKQRTKSGQIIDVETTSHSIEYAGHKAVLAVAHDITQRKQAERALLESESSLKRALAIAHLGDWSWDIQTNNVSASDEIYRIFGLDRGIFTDQLSDIVDAIHPDDKPQIGQIIDAALNGKTITSLEFRVLQPDGSIRHVWAETGEIVKDTEGNFLRLSGTVQDITEHKLAQMALQEVEARYQMLVEEASDGIFISNHEGRYIEVNSAGCALSGYSREEILQMSMNDLVKVTADTPLRLKELQAGISILSERDLLRKDGTIIPIEISAKRLLDGTFQGITRDITERKAAEKALQESEHSLKRAQAMAHIGDWTWDTQTNSVRWSDEMFHIFGVDQATFTGNLSEIIETTIHPDDQARVNQINEAVVNEQKSSPLEYRIVWPDGSVHDVWAEAGEAITDPEGKVLYLSGIVQDITERKAAEKALQESEARYRLLIEQASDAIFIIDDQNRYIEANTAACKLLGYSREEILQKKIPDLVKIEPHIPIRHQQLREGKTLIREREMIRKDGILVPVEFSSKLLPDGNVQTIGRDITERKQTEKALQESEARYRLLIEQASDAIMIAQEDGYYIEANSAACELTGYSREEILQKKMLDLFVIPAEKPLRRAELQQGKTLLSERAMIRKDGTHVLVEVSSKLLDDGTVQAIARDITERLQAEEELRLKSAALESAANGIMITDVNGTIEWVNPAFTNLTGYTLDEAMGHNPRDLVRSGLHNRLFYGEMWNTILAGKVWQGELVNRRKSGVLYTQEETITPVRNPAGEITHFIAIQQDISERKLTEAAIQKLNTELEERVIERTTQLNHIKNRIESILNSNADSIVYSSINGAIEQVNPAFEQAFGYPADEISLQPLSKLVVSEDVLDLEAAFKAVIINRYAQQVDVRAALRDGATFEAAMTLSPVIENNDKLVGIVLSIHDVTSRNHMLRHAMDLSELKSRYVSMAAHDLRNPMAVILTSSDTLQHYSDRLTEDKKQAKYAQIKTSIKNMTDILDDVLVMGQVDSGKLDFHPALLDVVGFCQTLIVETIQATGTGIHINFSTEGLSDSVAMDAKLLRHILGNLLSNAIKYSPPDSTVIFTAHNTHDHMVFKIQDHGIGIPKADQTRLFETFYRASNAKNIRGTGLGLAIVKQSTELHGGTITFESQEGCGTIFIVTLPTATT